MLPALHRTRVPGRDVGHAGARNPADQLGRDGLAAESDGHQRPHPLRLHGRAARGGDDPRLGDVAHAQRARRRGTLDAARSSDGRVSARAELVEDVDHVGSPAVLRRDPDDRVDALRPERLLSAKRKAGSGRPEEG